MTMRTTIKTIAALLIVFSAAQANASVDSASMTTYCRILAQDEADIYKVIFQAAQKEDVNISFRNTYDQLVHRESVKSTESFVKRFDLGNLPDGAYKVEVTSPGYSYEESIKIGDLSGYHFILKDLKERKIALVGSQPAGKDLTVVILDSQSEEIYHETLTETTQVRKQFQFGPYAGKQVTFLLYHENRLVKRESFEL